MISSLLKNQVGDTIVEVLIALTLITFVLVGAYYTANQSYRNNIDAQEHTQAYGVAQNQIEYLKIFGSGISSGNCLLDNGSSVIQASNTPSTNGCNVESNNLSSSGYKYSCPTSSPFCYAVSINKIAASSYSLPLTGANLNTYQISVSWKALGGGSSDDVSLYYRLDN
jgi:Tfp pilus assembly protein PilV